MTHPDSPGADLSSDRRELLALLAVVDEPAAAGPRIGRSARSRALPLSFVQERMWVSERLANGRFNNATTSCVRARGTFDIDVFRRAINEIVRRHEIFRTRFVDAGSGPAPQIAEQLTIDVPLIDLRGLSHDEREAEVRRRVKHDVGRPFDLTQLPLLRNAVFQLADDEYVFVFAAHHITFDGWSGRIFVDELSALYEAFAQGLPSPLAELPIQYVDFAAWQRDWVRQDEIQGQLAYWKQQLGGRLTPLEFPADRPRPEVRTFAGAAHRFQLSETLSRGIARLARKEGVTPFMILLAAYDILLHRCTGQDEVVVGSPVANRHQLETAKLIGCFMHPLVLRVDLSGDPSFHELLGRVRQVCLAAYAHQDAPFELVVRALHPQIEPGRLPLFQTLFNVQQSGTAAVRLPGLTFAVQEPDTETATLDLSMNLWFGGDRAWGVVEYSTELFDATTIEWLTNCFQSVLESIIADPACCLSELPISAQAKAAASPVNDQSADLSDERRALLELLMADESKRTAPAPLARQSAEEELRPASFGQERLWFFDRLHPGNSLFNQSQSSRLDGPLDATVLLGALNEIVRRHEVLRTGFESLNGRSMQRIVADLQLELPLVDLTHLAADAQPAELRRITTAFGEQPFDLAKPPLFRVKLVRLAAQRHVLLLTVHHIISDGWSLAVFRGELAALYKTLLHGQTPALDELPIQYADYAVWQRQWYREAVLAGQLTYWKRQLGGELPVLELPADRPRPAGISLRRKRSLTFDLPRELGTELDALCRRTGSTLFMALLAAFKTLLYRYTGQTDVIVDSPIAGRNRVELEGLIGFFVNSLALRTDLSCQPSFVELLQRVRQVCLDAYGHQDLPFDRVIAELQPNRYRDGRPLTPTSFMLHDAITQAVGLADDLLLTPLDANINDEFDLTLVMWKGSGGLTGTLQYDPAQFESSTIERMATHFVNLLASIVARPDQRISELPLLADDERRQLLIDWEAAEKPPSEDACVYQLFEAQASQKPDAVAVVSGGSQREHDATEVGVAEGATTYGELNRQANQLAHHLRSLGAGPETRIGICLDRSPAMLVAVLGVMKAGAAYVPLDATYSAQRLEHMLRDSQTSILITTTELSARVPDTAIPRLLLDRDAAALAAHGDENPAPQATPDHLAYVMYTSGSTGKPKGALIPHRNLANAYWGWEQAYHLRDETTCHLQMASFSFDVFAGDFVRALCSGAKLVLCPREVLLAPHELYELLRRESVDAAEFVPAVVRPLVQHLEETRQSLDFMRLVIVGSDTWNGGEYERLRQTCGPRTRIINSYGVAEATIDSSYFETTAKLPSDRVVPIGRPFAHTQMVVLDRQLQPCPIGVPGELYLGGAGLARSYLNQPGLTALKFVPDPFSQRPGVRLYRTGDQARFLADGNLEFLGRTDHQVKIRGFRIEPGEIEAALSEHPAVTRALVMAHDGSAGGKQLVAYVVKNPAWQPAPQEMPADLVTDLRRELREHLPEYMVPAWIILLNALPLNASGKIDRRALPAPTEEDHSREVFTPPATEIQQKIATIWSEVLRVDRVGLHDNFFDLGGQSLLLVAVQSRLREQFDEEIPLTEFFTLTTVEALARRLAGGAGQKSAPQASSTRRVTFARDQQQDGIAVIGMSGSYPGAKNIEQFWNNLRNGTESISFFSDDEHEHPVWADHDTEFVKAKGVLEGAEWFDAAFFGYTPEEAKEMDPQHRVFLERAYEAVENAGYDAESYPESIAVFAGVSGNTYLITNVYTRNKAARAYLTDKDFAATRVSYKLNLRGPSVVVQSACSTSLLAVSLACQSLLNGQCKMALAGGATVWVPTRSGYPNLPGAPMSSDGHCRAFDAEATGFVPGSGAGALLLKRLSDAIEDGDSIAAVIKGFAVNNDGKAKIGYTAPSIEGQAEVITQAHESAGIDPETITYIEAHGTGTDLGDPIEIAALTSAFRARTTKKQFCAVGSVKTNIGHLDAAAGVAGLTKAILAMQHRQLPPSLHFETPNPQIDFANSPFFVNAQLADWNPDCGVRRAGVSAFGIGGTNTHVIVEEAPCLPASESDDRYQLLVLSAKSPAALDAAANNLADHLETHPDVNLADVAYTLQVGRKRFSHRRIVVCRDLEDACVSLRSSQPERVQSRIGDETTTQVVFLFPGQSAQYPGMARELYADEAVFRDVVDHCCLILEPELGVDLRQVIYPAVNDDEAAERLTRTLFAQPAIFVIEYALAQLWLSLGVQPAACIGHSLGEYVAACLAGVLDLEDALRLVATRSRLIDRVPPGIMMAVRLTEEEVRPWLSHDVALAAVNGPSLCVLSGPVERMGELEERLIQASVSPIRLHASHAFHSAMMDPILDEFRRFLATVTLREPTLPYLSNLAGDWIEKSQPQDPEYWVRHLREAVRFSQSLEVLFAEPGRTLLEVGPGRTLSSLAQAHPACGKNRVVAASMRHPRETHSDSAMLLKAAGQLWLGGAELDWQKFHTLRRRRVPLPTYPFQRQRYWTLDDPVDADLGGAAVRKQGSADRFYVPTWKRIPLHAAAGEEALPGGEQCWLLFVDECGLGGDVAEQLERAHCPTLTVEIGDSFRQLGERRYQVNPLSPDDFTALVQQLRQNDQLPSVVAHFWGVTGDADPRRAASSGRIGFYSLLYLAQALSAAGVTTPLEIAVVTDTAQVVTGDERIVAEKSLIQGPCRVLPQEFGHITCRHLDVPCPSATPRETSNERETGKGVALGAISRDLIAEIAGRSSDTVVAFRNGYRWVQTYEAAPLEKPDDARPLPLRPDGVYLVTGGLGGMGLVLAQWLADAVHAKLVLTARTALPARDSWGKWLAQHDEDDTTSRKIRAVESLERAGGEVLVVAADVCDEARMREVVALTAERFGSLDGVIHAAGVAGGGVVQLKTREMTERVLSPKVDGVRVLERVVDGQSLDFLVVCSSLSAIVGGFGQIDYCAANAFMDAFAWENKANGGAPVIAVNWNAWREVGMAVETDLPAGLQSVKKQVGLTDSLTNVEGVDALQRILGATYEPQVAISLTNLPAFLRQQQLDHATQDLVLAAGPVAGGQSRPDLATVYVPPATDTEVAVAEIWQSLFGYDRIGTQDDFFELGGHSLLALQILERFRAARGINLPLTIVFEHRTIASLSGYLTANSPDASSVTAQPGPGSADGTAAATEAESSSLPGGQQVAAGIPALVALPRDGDIPLSYAQEGAWFIYQLQPGVAFNIVWPMRLLGELDLANVQAAFGEIIRRHEVLRTTYDATGGRPCQVIHQPTDVPIPIVDLRELGDDERTNTLRERVIELARQPFELEHGPLLRLTLFRLADDDQVLLFVVHHSVFDGWSVKLFAREFSALYASQQSGGEASLPSLPVQYADYAVWQRQLLQGAFYETQLAYWRDQLNDCPAELPLPKDRPTAEELFLGDVVSVAMPKELGHALRSLANREGVTLFMLLLAAYKTLLMRYSGQEDLVVGTPSANRNQEEMADVIGFCVNLLPLRTDLSENPSFRELMRRERNVCLGAFSHQEVPFGKLVQELDPARGVGHSPFFQVQFALHETATQPLDLPGLRLVPLFESEECSDELLSLMVQAQPATDHLFLNVVENEAELAAVMHFRSDLFDAESMRRMMRYLHRLLEAAVADPDRPIWDMPILAADERQRLLQDWSVARDAYAPGDCIHGLFSGQAALTPDADAVIMPAVEASGSAESRLTYAELERRANQLARYLRSTNMKPEDRVAVCMPRSTELMVAILGVWKAGATLALLDHSHGLERLQFILRDSQAGVLLTQQGLVDDLSDVGVPVIDVDAARNEIENEAEENPHVAVDDRQLAYLVYTSGSTGRPKGVTVSHRSLVNAYRAWEDSYGIRDTRRHLQMANLTFDVFIGDLVRALCSGAALVVCPRESLLVPEELYALLQRYEIDCAEFVPAVVRLLLEHLHQTGGRLDEMKLLICGSDTWSAAEYRKLRGTVGDATRVINSYGVAEATIDSSYFEDREASLADDRAIPIGRPFAGSEMYILDRRMEPTPVGVPGELYLGGTGLARGYLNRPDLTAERFVAHPFSDRPGERLYRTGDRARFLANGQIEFIGRVDQQIKIRGFRIEPGEVEAVLGEHPGVLQAVVLAREDRPGEMQLVGYAACREPAPTVAELRQFMRGKLPDYMVPSAFIMLDEFPLTPSGKLNRRALPAPTSLHHDFAQYVPPRTLTEMELARVWADVLGVDRVGANDDFFALGGHSLLAAKLISETRSHFKIDLPLRSLFENPSVSALARVVEQATLSTATTLPAIERIPHPDRIPLSYAQEGAWFVEQMQPGTPFNIPLPLHLRGEFDWASFERALAKVVDRHEALRTDIVAGDGEPYQIVVDGRPAPLEMVDLRDRPRGMRQKELLGQLIDSAAIPFSLSRGPLLRVTVFQLADDEQVILFTAHHIIFDGHSVAIFARDLAAYYEADRRGTEAVLPPLTVHYTDYAIWQRKILSGEFLESQLNYWREQLANYPAGLNLLTDRRKPEAELFQGDTVSTMLSASLSESLRSLSQHEGCTLFMLLLAAFKTLLARYSGQDDIIVGTPVANRNQREMAEVIGFCVNMLALRTDLAGNPSFRELLSREREVCLGAYAHQELPFGLLVQHLRPDRHVSHSPFFSVGFSLHQVPVSAETLPDVKLSASLDFDEQDIAEELERRRADVTPATDLLFLQMTDAGEQISAVMHHSSGLFSSTTIERMMRHFEKLLEGIAANPAATLYEIPLLDVSERQRVLVEWNDTSAAFTRGAALHHVFEAQVGRTPEAVAVVVPAGAGAGSEDEQLTYDQLNRRANRLACYLVAQGVRAEARIGICMERSLDMMVAIWAVLKAGGAYVPLDHTHGTERLQHMLEDSRAEIVLTHRDLYADGDSAMHVIAIDRERDTIARNSDDNLAAEVDDRQLAYVIFTSGSTGRPKGVMVSHGSLVNAYYAWEAAYGLEALTCHLQMANFSFDVFTGDMVRALCSGARLVLCPRESLLMGDELCELLRRFQVDCAEFVPAVVRGLSEHLGRTGENLDDMRMLLVGSDSWYVSEVEQLQRLAGDHTRVVNSYGVAEVTIDSTYYQWDGSKLSADALVPIGRPFRNSRAYVLDAYLHPVPLGAAGELYIGGAGLARGYCDRADLTAERFVPDPFSDLPGDRLYRTGDRTRYLPDGNIEFLGRVDHQIKIRGFRIEPGEVEAALAEHPDVAEVIVQAHGEATGEKRLVAYVSRRGPGQGEADQAEPDQAELDQAELRAFLQGRVPDYMVPSAFVILDAFPLTPSGKLDRRALPDPSGIRPDLTRDYVAPRTSTEVELARLWSEVLEVDRVGINDSFFALGGHSLLAAKLVARVRDGLQQDLPLRTLFERPTIAALAQYLESEREAGDVQLLPPEIVTVQPRGTKPPLFLLHAVDGNVVAYMDFVRHFDDDQPVYGLQHPGLLDADACERTLEELAAHYLQVIRSVQPQGPYLLAGWSLGGVLAFELARQLDQQECEIGLVALIDSRVWTAEHAEHAEIRARQQAEGQFGLSVESFLQLSSDEQVNLVLDRARAATGSLDDLALVQKLADEFRLPVDQLVFLLEESIPAEHSDPWREFLSRARQRFGALAEDRREQLQRQLRVVRNLMTGLGQYRPQPFRGSLVLLRADEAPDDDVALGWRQLADLGVTVHACAGHHFSIMRDPQAREAARIVQESIENALTTIAETAGVKGSPS